MRFLAFTTAFLAPFCVRAAVQFTNDAFKDITVGKAFNLTWLGDGTPVTITLMNGPAADLAKVMDVATNAVGSSYMWNPPASVVSGDYVFEIQQSGAINYSPYFHIAGGTPASPGANPAPQVAAGVSATAAPPATTTAPTPQTTGTGTWAQFTPAYAAMVTQAPSSLGNASGSGFRMSTSSIVSGYPGSHTVPFNFTGKADRMGVKGLVVGVVVIGAGVANWA